jgi:hypothetical protein
MESMFPTKLEFLKFILVFMVFGLSIGGGVVLMWKLFSYFSREDEEVEVKEVDHEN